MSKGPDTFEEAQGCASPVPLLGSGAEAAEHSERDIDQPGVDALLTIRKVARTRSDLGPVELGGS